MKRTPEEIVDLVEVVATATLGRRNRMDADRSLLRLEEYDVNADDTGLPLGTDYQSFTANEPLAFARKVTTVIADAKLLIQVPYGMAQEPERQRYDRAERFHYGNLNAANDRLRRKIQLELQDHLAGIVPLRGWGSVWGWVLP